MSGITGDGDDTICFVASRELDGVKPVPGFTDAISLQRLARTPIFEVHESDAVGLLPYHLETKRRDPDDADGVGWLCLRCAYECGGEQFGEEEGADDIHPHVNLMTLGGRCRSLRVQRLNTGIVEQDMDLAFP